MPKTENINSNLINVKSSSKQSNPDFKQHDELKSTTDLEKETIEEVFRILRSEFE